MELLYNMLSIAQTYKDTDRQYKNLNFQLKYTLRKAYHLLEKFQLKKVKQQNQFFIVNINRRIKDAQEITNDFDKLLNAETIAMKDKIRLSLPFNQAKKSAIQGLQGLEKAISDMNEWLDCNQIEDIPVDKHDDENLQNQSKIIKKKHKCERISIISAKPNVALHQSVQLDNINKIKIDPKIQQYQFLQLPHSQAKQQQQQEQMVPTIRSQQYYNLNHKKQNRQLLCVTIDILTNCEQLQSILTNNKQLCEIQYKIDLNAERNVSEQQIELKNSKYIKNMKNNKNKEQNIVHTVSRIYYKCIYSQIKKITPEIDGISKNGHFHFIVINSVKNKSNFPKQDIFKELSQKSQLKERQQIITTTNKSSLKRSKTRDMTAEKQNQFTNNINLEDIDVIKPDQDMFYSFPAFKSSNSAYSNFKLIMRKLDSKKNVYRQRSSQWVSIDEEQIQIMNGDCFAAYIDKKKSEPQLFYKVSYGIEIM